MPDATVKIKGTDIQVITDTAGIFNINVSELENVIKPILAISYIGFETVEITLDLASRKPLRVAMIENVMGEVCIRRRPTLLNKVKGVFKIRTQ